MKAVANRAWAQAAGALAGRLQRLAAAEPPVAAAARGASLVPLQRVAVAAPGLRPLPWLAAQTEPRRLYWRDRDNHDETAALGVAWECRVEDEPELPALLARVRSVLPPGARAWGGLAFPGQDLSEPAWRPFGRARFFVPRLELSCRPGQVPELAAYFRSGDAAATLAALAAGRAPMAAADPVSPWPAAAGMAPAAAVWQEAAAAALARLAAGQLTKVVLAARRQVPLPAPLDPAGVLARWRRAGARRFLFAFQLERELVFLGASPELLYRREGDRLASEALAGTRPRGATRAADLRLARELRRAPKEVEEHRLVMAALREWLGPLCRELDAAPRARLRRLPGVQHLYQELAAALVPGVGDAELLAALHPTPAVGGLPRAEALAFIRAHEPFARGWYASPVGWLNADAACFTVAIRSGCAHGRTLWLYAGAGLVPGSVPADEWAEVQMKLDSLAGGSPKSGGPSRGSGGAG